MTRRAALPILGVVALLLTPGAPGLPDVPGDPTPPEVTPLITGTLGDAGWYTTNVTVNWSVTDPESIILSTSGCDARTLTADTTGTRLSCTATSDGGETTIAKTFKVDKTAPATNATPSRDPDANGWYNRALVVQFSGGDATSGLASCSEPQSYAGPDTGGTSLSGTCRDQAGNVASAAFPLRYDQTAPQATAAARAPDANGWYNHAVTVSFQGADATSGVASCTEMTYAGPDDPSVALSGICVDRAGNQSGSSVFTLRYDETAPQASATASRGADVNGWYNQPLTVTFAGSDATSGLDSCDPAKTYSGPDAAAASVAGACRDRAGNVAPRSVGFKYDSTAPQTTATPSRQANANGWYNAPLTVGFAGTDSTSGVASCAAPKSYSGPDAAAATVTGACVDNAGNTRTISLPLRYDATAPHATATPSRQPNGNGWYGAPFTVTFTGTDATAGIESCDAAATYSGPDTASTSLGGACRDRAGNSASASLGFKYDATAPTVTATPGRAADANGWYNHPLAVTFGGTDATSTVATCDAAKSYAGPDSTAAAVTGTCTDKAGNLGSASFALRYDATAPAATVTPSRAPNANGWYNAALNVAFAATDAVSGVASCPAPIRYAGPDAAGAVVGGTCVDNAGNGAIAALPLNYDTTPPEARASAREPDASGWYRRPLTVGFAGSDATSGVESCTGAKDYAGPDTAAASFTGSCRDRAGNDSPVIAFNLRYDATAPQVANAIAVRPPDRHDWYNRPVTFAVTGADALSGIDSCPVVTYAGPDAKAAAVTASCVDKAGNRGSRDFALRYDGTAPATRAAASRAPDANGWYRAPVTVSFAGEDSVSGLEACDAAAAYDGPDTAHAVVGGMCLDKAGNVGLAALPLHFDSTAPQVTGVAPERPADANGWYNRPLEVSFHGADATSGVESCTKAGYAGPDAAAASLTGSCRDHAGNTSAAASYALRYDATPPTLTGLSAKAENRAVTLSWTASTDTTLVEIRRSGRLVYRGRETRFRDAGLENGRRYRYGLTGYDEAGNAATASAAATPTAPLTSPAAGAKVSAPPRLAWTRVPKATYYNVQLWRRGRILSAWPARPALQLRRRWTYAGRQYRLAPGRYRWFVWPGFGRRAEKRFGPLLGSSSFVVVR